MPEEKPDVLIIELCKQGHSGWFQDDTIGTAQPIELTSASLTFIPSVGSRMVEWTDPKTGKKVKKLEKIRWVKGQEEISMAVQKERGIEPEGGPNKPDIIHMEKERFSVAREGELIGLFDYLQQATYNEAAPGRPNKATAIYRTLKLDGNVEALNEADLTQADAVKYIGELYMKVPGGKTKYKEERIDALCEFFGVFADTYGGKINVLMTYAKSFAREFLDKVVKFEQIVVTKISHGIQMNVVKIENQTAMYVNKNKIIKSLTAKKRDEQIEEWAAYYNSAEGREAYNEFLIELDYAQEKSLKS